MQVIMEQLGGGGHLTMAGAQLREATLKETKQRLMDIIHEYRENQGAEARGAKKQGVKDPPGLGRAGAGRACGRLPGGALCAMIDRQTRPLLRTAGKVPAPQRESVFTMKIVLKQDVKSIGKKDGVYEVSDGYARNFLFPRGLAVEASASAVNEVKTKAAAKQHHAAEELAAAQYFKRYRGKQWP